MPVRKGSLTVNRVHQIQIKRSFIKKDHPNVIQMPKAVMLLASFALWSCGSEGSDIKTNSLNSSWHKNAEQQFDFNIAQAQNPKNITFVVRNDNSCAYCNIRVIVDVSNRITKKGDADTVD